MKQAIQITHDSIPKLPRHVKFRFDETRQKWLLLAPERVLVPDDIAVEVLQLCDGKATVEAIAAILAEKFEAPADVVGGDVIEMLQDLADKGVIQA